MPFIILMISLLSSPLYAKSVNLSVDPIAFGAYYPIPALNGSADFKIAKHLALGPVLSPSYFFPGYGAALGLGIQAEIFPLTEAFTDGWYIKPQTLMRGTFYEGQSSWTSFTALTTGYHWFFEKGFNLALGAGASYRGIAHNSFDQAPPSGFAPVLDVKIGYAF